MKQIYQKCDVCKGYGCIQTVDFEHGQITVAPGMVTTVCGKCNGMGFIETDLLVAEDIPNDFPKYITREG